LTLEDYLHKSHVTIWTETFVVMKSKKSYPNAFANITDKTETTVIIDETQVRTEDIIEIEPGWKMLTFDMVLPFRLVGFLATVTTALADKHIPIIAISAYSTDHILVKKNDVEQAKATLETLGCMVTE
jgi:hypothetical protein